MFGIIKRLVNKGVDRRVVVVERDSADISPTEWRSSKELVSSAARIVHDPTFKRMVDTVKYFHFNEFALVGNPQLDERAVRQAESQGFALAISMLVSLANPMPNLEMPEPTWGTETQPVDQ